MKGIKAIKKDVYNIAHAYERDTWMLSLGSTIPKFYFLSVECCVNPIVTTTAISFVVLINEFINHLLSSGYLSP